MTEYEQVWLTVQAKQTTYAYVVESAQKVPSHKMIQKVWDVQSIILSYLNIEEVHFTNNNNLLEFVWSEDRSQATDRIGVAADFTCGEESNRFGFASRTGWTNEHDNDRKK